MASSDPTQDPDLLKDPGPPLYPTPYEIPPGVLPEPAALSAFHAQEEARYAHPHESFIFELVVGDLSKKIRS